MSVFTAKVTLICKRAFLILSLLGFICQNTYAFWQNSSLKKTKYEFTDPRISKADTLLKKRQYQAALEAYQKAYDIYEAESFYEGMVYAEERMGLAHRRLGRDSLSEISYELAAEMSRRRLESNHILESKAYLSNGIRTHSKNQFMNASEYLDSAMWVYQRSSNYDSAHLRNLVNYKFYTYYYSNRSIDTLIKYLEYRFELLEIEESNPSDELYLLNDYSMTFLQNGDFQNAMAYAIEGQKFGKENITVPNQYYAEALFNLGRSFYSQKEYEKALRITDELIDFTLENIPRYIELLAYYNLKAITLNSMGKPELAIVEFGRVLDSLEKQGLKNLFYRTTIMNLGVSYQLAGNDDLARKYLFQALEEERKANGVMGINFFDRYDYLGRLFESNAHYNEAIDYYDSALRSGVPSYVGGVLSFPDDPLSKPTYKVLNILKAKSVSLNALYNSISNDSTELLEASIDYSEKTHDYLMENRETLQASEGRLFLSETFKDLYEAGINSSYHLFNSSLDAEHYFKKALKFSTQSKSLLFLEQSGELGGVENSLLPKELKDSFFQIKSRIDDLESTFYQLLDEAVSSDSVRIVNSELLSLNKDLRSLKDSIASLIDDDSFSDARRTSEFDWDSILDYLESNPSKGIIEYFVGENDIYVLGLTKGKKVFKKVKFTDKLKTSFRTLLKEISNKPEVRDYPESLLLFQENSLFLFQKLLDEVLKEFEPGITSLTIVPDDLLSRLPFEVLLTRNIDNAQAFYDLSYLLNDYVLNYSLSVQEINSLDYGRKAENQLLGIGYSGNLESEVRSEFGNLPGTEEEIKFLEANLQGDFFHGPLGSKSMFLEKAREYDILHLAIHGRASTTDRYQSSLIFNGSTDNVLKTSDLYVAGLTARLAVLSACESGIGEINKGEGTFSIARGFALVGVPSVLMSAWKVNDAVASSLMVEVHKAFIDGQPINRALSLAKKNYLEESDRYTSHPYYWSAFVSLGREVEIEKSQSKMKLLGLYVILGLTLLYVFYHFLVKKRKGVK